MNLLPLTLYYIPKVLKCNEYSTLFNITTYVYCLSTLSLVLFSYNQYSLKDIGSLHYTLYNN